MCDINVTVGTDERNESFRNGGHAHVYLPVLVVLITIKISRYAL